MSSLGQLCATGQATGINVRAAKGKNNMNVLHCMVFCEVMVRMCQVSACLSCTERAHQHAVSYNQAAATAQVAVLLCYTARCWQLL